MTQRDSRADGAQATSRQDEAGYARPGRAGPGPAPPRRPGLSCGLPVGARTYSDPEAMALLGGEGRGEAGGGGSSVRAGGRAEVTAGGESPAAEQTNATSPRALR